MLVNKSGSLSNFIAFNMKLLAHNFDVANPDTKNTKTVGKISIVKDPEGKRRLIAMVDYFSQVFLRKFHLDIFECLKLLPQDRTFTQSPRNK